jgi:putative zinc finger/helix-turn-helix YgiT family protein
MADEHIEYCYLCNNVAHRVQERREAVWLKRRVMIDDELYQCSSCGERYYDGFMAQEHDRRVAAAIRAEDGLLSPDEVRVVRMKYGLTQAGLETLIGSGEKTVVRWEKGSVAQTATADTLLRVLRDHPEVVARLAEERGVKLRRPNTAPAPATSASAVAVPEEQSPPEEVRHAA